MNEEMGDVDSANIIPDPQGDIAHKNSSETKIRFFRSRIKKWGEKALADITHKTSSEKEVSIKI